MRAADAGATSLPLGAASETCTVACWNRGGVSSAVATLVEETPIALVYNDVSHAVMLASPTNLDDFAVGFSLSEAIVDHADELEVVAMRAYCEGIEIRMRIAEQRLARLGHRRRALVGRSGCGLCGVTGLDQFTRPFAVLPDGGWASAQALHTAMLGLAEQQCLHRATGAVHAAGWSAWDGTVDMVREDVGRHNALDKLVGGLARKDVDTRDGFALVTSRASYEMVQKSALAGIRLLAAISAPTAMAVRLAERVNLTLVGFVRPGKHVIYTCPERIGN